MENVCYQENRLKAKYCDEDQSIPDFPYYVENGRIENNQVIEEFIDSTEIVEIEDYKEETVEELVNSLVNEWYLHEMQISLLMVIGIIRVQHK